MMEVACTCDEGCGVAHSHLGRRVEVRLKSGKVITVDQGTYELNAHQVEALRWLEDEVRPWVDWKAVARQATGGRQ